MKCYMEQFQVLLQTAVQMQETFEIEKKRHKTHMDVKNGNSSGNPENLAPQWYEATGA